MYKSRLGFGILGSANFESRDAKVLLATLPPS